MLPIVFLGLLYYAAVVRKARKWRVSYGACKRHFQGAGHDSRGYSQEAGRQGGRLDSACGRSGTRLHYEFLYGGAADCRAAFAGEAERFGLQNEQDAADMISELRRER